MGPDSETTKVLADVEMHAEDSRLKGYQDTLKNRDRQNERDHAFRKKRLNHETGVNIIVLIAAALGVVMGFYLYTNLVICTLSTQANSSEW